MTLSNRGLSFQFSLRGWFPIRRLAITRTEDNRLVDIGIPIPTEQIKLLYCRSSPLFFEPRHRNIGERIAAQIKECIGVYDMNGYKDNETNMQRGTLPPRTEVQGFRYPCTQTVNKND